MGKFVKKGRPPAFLEPVTDPSSNLAKAVQMVAMGQSLETVAALFKCSRKTLYTYFREPEVADALKMWRETIKHTILKRSAEGLVSGAFDMAHKTVADHDPKGFDATVRGIAALEKATASAAGEGAKVEVSGPGGAPIELDVRALMAEIIAHVEKTDAVSQVS